MNGEPRGRSRRFAAGRWIFLVALAAAAGFLAHAVLFGQFSVYDDEGYMLLALRAWRAGGGLYDRIETIYGPTTFQLVVAVFALLGLPLDNSGAREFVLGIWMTTTFLCGLYVFRVHRSLVAATVAAALVFPILHVLAKEPLHAGDAVVLLLSLIALASLRLGNEEPGRGTWPLLGALTAALALTKLNVGVFAVLAVCATWARYASRNAWASAARAGLSMLLVAFPYLLTRELSGRAWVTGFANLASGSLLPFALLLHAPSRGRPSSAANLRAFALGGLALGTVSFAICFATGTTAAGAWRCLVTDTLRFTDFSTNLAVVLPPAAELVVSLLLVPVALLLLGSRRRGAETALLLLRVAACVGLLYASTAPVRHLAALPCLWPFALPRREDRDDAPGERPAAFLALLVALQALHAYPLPASQRGFFGFLLPVLAVVGLVDVGKEMRRRARERTAEDRSGTWKVRLAAVACCALVALDPLWHDIVARFVDYHRHEVELLLPGTRGLRLPERQVANYVWLAENLRRHGDTFVALPGRHSFYLWTEQEPPVPFYSAWWPVALDEPRQRALGEALLAHRDPCVLRAPGFVNTWTRSGVLGESVLARWIDERFVTVGRVASPGLELLIPKGKRADLVLTAFLERTNEGAPEDSPGRARLRLALPERRAARIARFTVLHCPSDAVLCDSDATEPERRLLLVDAAGREIGGTPVSLDRRRDVLALCPAEIDDLRLLHSIVRCYDDRGEIAARLPVLR